MKECLTVLALALADVTSHWPVSPQANDRHVVAWKEEHRAENVGGEKKEEARRNLSQSNLSEENGMGRTYIFNLLV
jgi:hypothetical protein